MCKRRLPLGMVQCRTAIYALEELAWQIAFGEQKQDVWQTTIGSEAIINAPALSKEGVF